MSIFRRKKTVSEIAAEQKTQEQKSLPLYRDTEIVAPVTGRMVGPEKIEDPIFAEEEMGTTIAINPDPSMETGEYVAPANGVLEMLYETGHAYGVRMADGTAIVVHIGVDTVTLNGEGFEILKHQGDRVKAGEPVIRVNLAKVRQEGLSTQTILVFSEMPENVRLSYYLFGEVVESQSIAELSVRQDA